VSALSEANYHDTVMKRINEKYAALQPTELEEQVQRGVRSRKLAYGSADLDLDIFASRLDQHKGPEWLGQEGNEQMTERWHELDEQAREDIDAFEDAIHALHKLKPGESLTHAKFRHSCTCGQSCWIKDAAHLRASSFIRDHLDEAERAAEFREERSVAEQALFNCKIKRFVQHLECGLDIGKQVPAEVRGLLLLIVAHADGMYFLVEEQDLYVSKSSLCDPIASLKLYIRWLRRNPKIELDGELVESLRTVMKRAVLMKEDGTEPLNDTATH